jgi:hypothetical protein
VVPGGLSTGARWVLFAGMTAYLSYFAYRRLWPLCVRAINPVYAAHTIEHGSPALKNSLINLLMFRQRRADISDAVYRTLEEEAAHGLTRVHVDASVDQSQLIRLGYFLIGIVAVAAMYKIFSPKDPLVAAERVLMPWANVVPASRVSIKEIKPGVATISRGEYVDVSAEVRGLKDEENVVLRCTTDDGQVVGRAIPMKGSADGLRFTCRLADEADGGESVGVTRSLIYWLEAGDARSLNYAITVVPAASILVERVDYDYPTYTGYVDHSVEGIGDIRAIEGTKVTVHARANSPIRQANVDYDADGRRDLTMSAAEAKARATFELALREDRQTPWHASYVLRFTNDEGRENNGPVKHAINVDRDLSPETEIRLPQEKSRDVRVDESVAIEVDARDPDFSLAAVRLRAEAAGRAVINEPLLVGEQRGRFAGRYVFTPSAHGLKSGDVLAYWVEADDNRTPKPNTTASERRELRIMSPNPAQQPPPNQLAQNDKQQAPQQGEQENQQPQNGQKGGEKQDGGKQGQNSGKPQEGQEGGQAQQGEGGEGQQSKGQEGKEQGEGKGSQQGESGGQSKPGQQGGEGQQADANQNQDASGQNDGKGQKGSPGQSPPGESSPDQQDPTESDGEQKGGESSQGGQKSQGGGQSKGQQPEKQGEEQTPVSSEGDNDAEAFNRIQKHLQEKGELKKDDSGAGEQSTGEKSAGEKSNDPKQPFSRDAERSAEQQGQGDKETGRQGDKEGEQAKNNDQKSQEGAGEPKSSDGKSGEKSTDGAQQKEKQKPEGTPSNDRGEGKGAETRGDDTGKKPEPDQGQQQQEKSPGGEQTNSKGAAGDGNEQKSQGAPNSKPEMKPTEKPEQTPSKSEKTNQQEPPAGANSKKESDSHGDQGGDKAGGGEEGGGQKAPREGTGSAGQNQSADNGAGQSGEKGQGENSSEGGQDAKSEQKTGASDGKTPGKGSQQKDGTGDKSGGKQGASDKDGSAGGQDQPFSRDAERSAEQQGKGDKETGRQGDKEAKKPGESEAPKQGEKSAGKAGDTESKNGKQDNNENQNADNTNAGSASGGGGQPGGAVNPSPSSTGEAPEGDAANLEYARKQTDLVLDKVADQLSRKKVDGELLKELGWSEAELKRFLDRWQQRKAAAEQKDEAGDAAKRELDDALRSLGLHRGELQQNTATKDNMRDLKEGYRGPVPAEYKERLRAYNQGVSRANRENE